MNHYFNSDKIGVHLLKVSHLKRFLWVKAVIPVIISHVFLTKEGGGVGGGLVGHDSSLLEALYAVCSMQSTGVLLDTFDVFCHEFAQRSVLYG